MNTNTPRADNDIAFRDLNKNGRLDPYEDPRQPIEARVDDLLAQMTLEEKAGLMFHTILEVDAGDETFSRPGRLNPFTTSEMVGGRLINHFNIHQTPPARETAAWHNRLQKLAEETRLGIPITLSSDPRHAFTRNIAVGMTTPSFSQWPEPIGLAATRDVALARQFADIARQEYLAIGIRVAL